MGSQYGKKVYQQRQVNANGASRQWSDDATANVKRTDNQHSIDDDVYGASDITTFADLEQYAAGSIIRLPDFGNGQKFVARVRRPSMLALSKSGKIPNSLLKTASNLFTKGGQGMDASREGFLQETYDVMMLFAKASLVQPTLEEIEEAGLELTDDQLMAIFSYAQVGVKALDKFRTE